MERRTLYSPTLTGSCVICDHQRHNCRMNPCMDRPSLRLYTWLVPTQPSPRPVENLLNRVICSTIRSPIVVSAALRSSAACGAERPGGRRDEPSGYLEGFQRANMLNKSCYDSGGCRFARPSIKKETCCSSLRGQETRSNLCFSTAYSILASFGSCFLSGTRRCHSAKCNRGVKFKIKAADQSSLPDAGRSRRHLDSLRICPIFCYCHAVYEINKVLG